MNNKVTISYNGKEVEIELTAEQIREIEEETRVRVKVEKFVPKLK